MTITRQQVLDCFASDDLIGVGMEADAIRRNLHPDGIVSYTKTVRLDCTAAGFLQEAAEAAEDGATGLALTGIPSLELVLESLTSIRTRFPTLRLGGLSTATVAAMSGDALPRLQAAGFDWLGGADHGILADPLRTEMRTAEWLRIHRQAHALGLRSAAGMTFGCGETPEQRLELLDAIRNLQSETGGFFAFTPTALQHDIAAGGRSLDEATSVEVLKTLAICRLYLDNIENIEADWLTQGTKVLQMALRFGANDTGAAGPEPGTSEEDLRRIIRDAGFRPVERDSLYGTMYLD